ncbi:MAG: SEC-C metal-binding domain-containing protein [Phycisphaerales bacterium]|nr:SEC-C metal-binding domain-containing protein [Phycisphaerales bacterium]
MIYSTIEGADHTDKSRGAIPFVVGHINKNKGFVHVLDDESLDLVLRTLDTISDFLDYLKAKEQLLTTRNVMSIGEEELLGRYLLHTNVDSRHHFGVEEKHDFIGITAGHWSEAVNGPLKRAARANVVSYAWDKIIDKFITHMLGGTQYYTSHPGQPYGIEMALRKMAAENRLRRRMLAKALIDLVLQAQGHNGRANRIIPPTNAGEPHYVFLCLPKLANHSEPEYREIRRNFLERCCEAVKARFPDASEIVGLATESGINSSVSEDLMYLDASSFSADDIADAIKTANKLGLFVNLTQSRVTEYEYPRPGKLPPTLLGPLKRIPRNNPCPCGSGRKYKKCCMS